MPSLGEEWRPVLGWEGWYEVSNLGRVRRVKEYNGCHAGHILKPRPNYKGYLSLGLSRPGMHRFISVASLVAEAFIGPRPAGLQINHEDGVKTNNAAANLEWTTPGDNIRHAHRSGLVHHAVGENHGRARLTENAVRAIRASSEGAVKLALRFGISRRHVWEIRTRRVWRHV